MAEVNLLDPYPRSRRPIAERHAAVARERDAAMQFGREYFDGTREQGYGGYRYDGRWLPVAERIRYYYGLKGGDTVLDAGCAKGFLLHDLAHVTPGLRVTGIDVSAYALSHAMDTVAPHLARATVDALPFRDGAFDLVISINTIHNLEDWRCRQAVRELQRVGRGRAYIQVDSWLNDRQRDNFERWQLTARTSFAPEGWRRLFAEEGYTGDYYWTLTE